MMLDIHPRKIAFWAMSLITLSLLSLALPQTQAADDSPAPKIMHTYDDYLIVPVSVHILSAKELPEIDCALTDADIHRILSKVNNIWHHAGIHWTLDKLIHESAAEQDVFKKRKSARPKGFSIPLSDFRPLAPEASRKNDGFHVYYIHKFSVNGVYLGDATAFVQETASLRPVEGGIDEPLPRVTAHELGHGLGLPHRQDRINLLASGTTGTSLNDAEITKARRTARATTGTRTVPIVRDLAEAATKTGDHVRAAQFWDILAEIPGDGAFLAAQRRDESTARQQQSEN